MLVLLEPTPVHHLAGVRVLLLHVGPAPEPDVVVDVKVKQRPALAPRLVHDEVVERRGVREDEVLLYVHEPVGRRVPQLAKLVAQHVPRLAQELRDGIPLQALDFPPVPPAVPVAERDLQLLLLDCVLLREELRLEPLALVPLRHLPVSIRQEVRLHLRVLANLANLLLLC